MRIRDLLLDAEATLSEGPFEASGDQSLDQTFIETRRDSVTRELYAGFVFAELGEYVRQSDFFKNTGSVVALEPPYDLKSGVIYFDGQWVVWPEHARYGRDTIGYEDVLSLVYSFRSLKAVVSSESGQPYTVRITLNGDFLTDENTGTDVAIAANGESLLSVNGAQEAQHHRSDGLLKRKQSDQEPELR